MSYSELSSLLQKEGETINSDDAQGLIDLTGCRLATVHNIHCYDTVGEFLVDMFELGSILVTRTTKSGASTCNAITLIHKDG